MSFTDLVYLAHVKFFSRPDNKTIACTYNSNTSCWSYVEDHTRKKNQTPRLNELNKVTGQVVNRYGFDLGSRNYESRETGEIERLVTHGGISTEKSLVSSNRGNRLSGWRIDLFFSCHS